MSLYRPNRFDFCITIKGFHSTPLGKLLGAPEEDHWQWFKSMPQLLGQEPPNKGPSQDWEFQLVDMQARGELDQPAYKNRSDDIVTTAQNAVAQGGDPAVGGGAMATAAAGILLAVTTTTPVAVVFGAAVLLGAMGYFASKASGELYDAIKAKLEPMAYLTRY